MEGLNKAFDCVSCSYFYYNLKTETKSLQTPRLLGRESGIQYYDPMDVSTWNIEDVALYFRKLGVSKLNEAQNMKEFCVKWGTFLIIWIFLVLIALR